MSLIATVSQTIEQHALVPQGAKLLVAVSGGPDSVALLHALKSLNLQIEAAHLNHQFRGDESDGDAAYVADLCDSLKIRLTTESVDVPRLKLENRISAQQAARHARYEFLEQTRALRGLDLIATAHTQDDRVETVLLNIIRGCGIDGLKGIPIRRDLIIRPLLETTRESVEAYVAGHGLIPRQDTSNLHSKYARNNVRSELIPYLERRFNPAVKLGLLRLSNLAAEESDFLASLARSWINGRKVLPVADLVKQPVALQRRIVREWLRDGVRLQLSDVSHVLIEQFRLGLLHPTAVTMPGGEFVAESDGTDASIRELPKGAAPILASITLPENEDVVFGDYVVNVMKIGPQIDGSSLHVRQWLDGDRITLKGGTRKVQDIFADRKLPRERRRTYPLIADKIGLVSVGDIHYASRAEGTLVSVVRTD